MTFFGLVRIVGFLRLTCHFWALWSALLDSVIPSGRSRTPKNATAHEDRLGCWQRWQSIVVERTYTVLVRVTMSRQFICPFELVLDPCAAMPEIDGSSLNDEYTSTLSHPRPERQRPRSSSSSSDHNHRTPCHKRSELPTAPHQHPTCDACSSC